MRGNIRATYNSTVRTVPFSWREKHGLEYGDSWYRDTGTSTHNPTKARSRDEDIHRDVPGSKKLLHRIVQPEMVGWSSLDRAQAMLFSVTIEAASVLA